MRFFIAISIIWICNWLIALTHVHIDHESDAIMGLFLIIGLFFCVVQDIKEIVKD